MIPDQQGLSPELEQRIRKLAKAIVLKPQMSEPASAVIRAREEALRALCLAAQAEERERLTKREVPCVHARRRDYSPDWSTGDESDYLSKCLTCGAVLRQEPNV